MYELALSEVVESSSSPKSSAHMVFLEFHIITKQTVLIEVPYLIVRIGFAVDFDVDVDVVGVGVGVDVVVPRH